MSIHRYTSAKIETLNLPDYATPDFVSLSLNSA